jgi:hypothetical protein
MIAEHIDYVVGMNTEIGDAAAIKFAVGFYDEIGAGWSYEDAYNGGCDAIALQGIPEENTPVFKNKKKSPILKTENTIDELAQRVSMNLPTNKNKPVYIYFSSCRQDEKILKELEKRLLVLEKDGIIEILHSGRIGVGRNIINERNEQLRKANVILLLVSTDYINSSEHRDVEVKQIMEKHNSGRAKVIPIVAKKCHWEREAYRDLNPLPRDRKPIASSIRRDDVFSAIVDEIINEIDKLRNI